MPRTGTALAAELRAAFPDADIAIDGAVTDGNLVSAPAWPAHPAWLSQFLVALGTSISHAGVRQAA